MRAVGQIRPVQSDWAARLKQRSSYHSEGLLLFAEAVGIGQRSCDVHHSLPADEPVYRGRAHQALGNRTPMAVWREGTSGCGQRLSPAASV